MNNREIEQAIRDEVAKWPGVEVEIVAGGKHPKAKLTLGDKTLFRAFGGNQSFVAYPHKMIADIRTTIAQLGATRSAPPPEKEEVERVYRERNQAAVDARPNPALINAERATPKRDLADQLVEGGAATPEARDAIQAERSAATYERAAGVRASAPLIVIEDDEEQPVESDEDREARLAALQQAIDAIEDGIYFDLAPEIYFAVPRLGSGSIADLIISPATFWRGSWLDPQRPELDEEQTKAQLVGKAYHIARLEPEKFDRLFVRQISRADFPAKGLLTSDQAVKAALKAAGQQQTYSGETVEDRCQRLLDCGYEGTIFPLEKARWAATVEGRQPLPAEIFDDIVVDMERLRGSGEIAEMLTGGFSEVSVFWTDQHGLKCKARIDYLKPQLWVDFKTFANPNGKVLAQAIADAFRYNRYYVQAVHYLDGLEAVRLRGLQIRGEATDEQRALIAKIQIGPDALECWYVFQEKGGVPNLLGRRFEFSALDTIRRHEIDAMVAEDRQADAAAALSRKTAIYNLGRAEIDQAKRAFVLYSQIYEPGQPWAPIEPMGTIGDLDFSSYWLEGRQ